MKNRKRKKVFSAGEENFSVRLARHFIDSRATFSGSQHGRGSGVLREKCVRRCSTRQKLGEFFFLRKLFAGPSVPSPRANFFLLARSLDGRRKKKFSPFPFSLIRKFSSIPRASWRGKELFGPVTNTHTTQAAQWPSRRQHEKSSVNKRSDEKLVVDPGRETTSSRTTRPRN